MTFKAILFCWASTLAVVLAAMLSAPGEAGADVGKPTIRIECSDMQSRIGRYGKEKGRLFRWRDCVIEIEWDVPVFYAGLRTHCDLPFNSGGGGLWRFCNRRYSKIEGGFCVDGGATEGGVVRDSTSIYAGKPFYKQLEIITGRGPDAVCYKRTLENLENDALYPCNDNEASDCGGFQTDVDEDTWGRIKATF